MVKPNGVTESAPDPDDLGTRERIMAAAHVVFLRRGTAAARTQEIADEAGVNKALLHYYFGSKKALADAVFQNAFFSFFPRLFRVVAKPDLALPDKVRMVVAEQLDFHSARPYLAAYVVSESNNEPERLRRLLEGAPRPPLDALQSQLDSEAAAKRIKPIAVEQFIVSLISLVIMPFAMRPMLDIMLGISGDRFDSFIAERRGTIADMFLAGLRP